MTRYCARAVLLVFGALYLAGCSTWQSVSTPSPDQFIEEDRPERVLVLMRGGMMASRVFGHGGPFHSS